MIAVNNERQDNETTWQSSFVTMLPEIQQRLRRAFRHLDAEAREEAIEEGVVHSLLSFARLHEQGRAEAATASTLAWYAALAVKRGRPAGSRMNGKEPLSRYAQVGNGIQVEQQPRQLDGPVGRRQAGLGTGSGCRETGCRCLVRDAAQVA